MARDLKPRYCQIRDDLLAAIREQRIRPNEQIPTEVEIMEQYGVSRTTVRRAIQDLVDNGVLTRRQGNGTFVNVPKYTRNVLRFISFTKDCLDHGDQPDTSVSQIETVEPTPELRQKLRMQSGEKIYCFERLRFINGEPVMIELNQVAGRYDFIGYSDKKELESLMTLFEDTHGIITGKYDSVLQISYATKREAGMLHIHEGAPVIIIEGVCCDEGTQPMYHFKQVIASERCKIDISGERRGRRDSGKENRN